MVSALDVSLARKAYYEGDLGPAQEILRQAPEELPRLLDTRALEGEASWDGHGRRNAFIAALREIEPTPALSKVLMTLALGTSREERELAQSVLARGEPPIAALIGELSSGAKDTRQHAAGWLARLRANEAIPTLVAAFRKEKVELVRAAMLRALVGLGAPIDRFLDRAQLEKDAQKVLAKGVPPALAFLAIDTLPHVSWKDGTAVPAEVVTSWLVTALKGKTPIASPLLTAYAAEMNEREREALGDAIYERWLDEDFRLPEPLDPDVRERLETWASNAGMPLEAYARTPTFRLNVGSLSWIVGKSVDIGALDQRGVLAVAAALAPRTLVPKLVKYVRDFRGIRIGASRAMLHMLAGMDDRAATQALVRFSMRFRTASLRKEAERLVNELAAARGWSSDELADRTIPTAGLDDDATLRLVYVEAREGADASDDVEDEGAVRVTRRFEGRLDTELELALFTVDEHGASLIAKLPEPRKDEDAAHAAAEKKRLASSKKELKTLIAAQRERLFASMCSERAMPLSDFRDVYLAHPIMRVLLARVLLLARDAEGRAIAACRVSEDGTFVTVDHDTLRLPEDATITIAHGSKLSDAEETRFADHLAEYELAPLFPQLGRARHALDASQPGLLRIVPPDQESISSFVVRGRMKRLGWERGPSGDGGWVDRYTRPFTSLRLEAVLVHTAVPQPETDTPITIEGIEVHRLPPPDAPLHAPRSVLLTSAVPSVLRHELWNDLLATIAR
ncbi:MAG: DUF4132 domain-containing protein [Deltaproteobacteria bacterium]|nr:DUF4132 domain-containing protein [Deltaproteobacteria bacterium]